MDIKKMGITTRLFEIFKESQSLNKKGYNEEGSYSFLKEADVKKEFKKLLLKYSVKLDIGRVEFAIKDGIKCLRVNYSWRSMDTQNEDNVVEKMIEAPILDTSDKGWFKTVTGINKYIYLLEFQIPTEEDPESDNKPPGKKTFSKKNKTVSDQTKDLEENFNGI